MFNTLMIIIEQSMMHVPLIIGSYISFSLLKVSDLSIETAYVVGAIFASSTLFYLEHYVSSYGLLILVLTASAVGGAVVGMVSSILTQKGKLPHLLSSIVTFGLFHGINQFISPAYISLNGVTNLLLSSHGFMKHPEIIMIFFISCLIICFISYIFNRQIGYAYAVHGNNPHFFSNYGISTSFVFITGIMLANALAGISGYIFAQSNNFVELNMGIGKALFCITSIILGKAIIAKKQTYSIFVPIAGTYAYFILQQLLLKIGLNLKYFTAIQAIIVVSILIYTYRTKSSHATDGNLGI